MVHNNMHTVVQVNLTGAATELMPWIDDLTRKRQALVQKARGPYRQRMGQAAQQLFARHAQDVPFLNFLSRFQSYPSYMEWFRANTLPNL